MALVVAGLLSLTGCGDEEDDQPPATTSPAGDTTTQGKPSETDSKPEVRDGDSKGGRAGDAEGQAEPSRPTSVAEVTEAVLTGSGSPELICDELVTERFVREAYGAREGCIAAQGPGAQARSIGAGTYSNTSGEVARVSVVPEGGPYDGIEVTVELVTDPEGAYRVDSLIADVPPGP